MRLSSSFVASSAIVVVSAVLLSGPAVSQVPTGSAATLPPVTVDAPKPAARPHRVERGTDTRTSHRTSSTTRVSTSDARTASPAPDTVLGRIAKYEKVASNCNGGCESSMPHGKDPWVGCSESGGGQTNAPFSPTCRDSLTYKSYVDCVETKVFLGEYRNRAYWICSSLSAGNKFQVQVAEARRSKRPN